MCVVLRVAYRHQRNLEITKTPAALFQWRVGVLGEGVLAQMNPGYYISL